MQVLRLSQLEDSLIKTRAYLTLEVLYASRRFQNDPQHIEVVVR